ALTRRLDVDASRLLHTVRAARERDEGADDRRDAESERDDPHQEQSLVRTGALGHARASLSFACWVRGAWAMGKERAKSPEWEMTACGAREAVEEDRAAVEEMSKIRRRRRWAATS